MYVSRAGGYQAVKKGGCNRLPLLLRKKVRGGGDVRSRRWEPRTVRNSDELHRWDGSAKINRRREPGYWEFFLWREIERLGGTDVGVGDTPCGQKAQSPHRRSAPPCSRHHYWFPAGI